MVHLSSSSGPSLSLLGYANTFRRSGSFTAHVAAMTPLATVGILSIGDMGLGVARLLADHSYRVVTNVTGRSQHTIDRCNSASIETLSSDSALVTQVGRNPS